MSLVNDLLRKVKLKLYLRRVKRHTLKVWLKLSDIQKQTQLAAEMQDVDGVYTSLTNYVSVAIGKSVDLPWVDFYVLYGEIANANKLDDKYPIIKPTGKEPSELPWEYDGRSEYFWVYVLSKNFGWSMEYIDNLDINQAIALLQEIEVDKQLEKEFVWNMSELAYPLQADGKTHKHKPLERPVWMVENPFIKYQQRERPKLNMKFMPVGNVVSADVKH